VTQRDPFGARLAKAIAERGPLCAGIDPHPALLDAWGLDRNAAGLERFALTAVEALAGTVAVLKPQSAFFEAFGSSGIAVLERVLAEVREAGALALLDAKRGDIGSTMAAYAAAYLTDGSPLAADAVTVSPFLGFGSLQPAIDAALGSGRGLFVLCRTSNAEGGQVQLAAAPGGYPVTGSGNPAVTVAQQIADAAATLNAGAAPLGSIGLVVGATVTQLGADLTRVNGPLLAPGLGAQGASAYDLRGVFGAVAGAVLPAASRSILSAGPSVTALRDAAAREAERVRAALG
jgi:orotidine-5'-phosphate decarboxylase